MIFLHLFLLHHHTGNNLVLHCAQRDPQWQCISISLAVRVQHQQEIRVFFFFSLLQVCGWHKFEVVASSSFFFSPPFLPPFFLSKQPRFSHQLNWRSCCQINQQKKTKQKRSRIHLSDSPPGASAQFVTGLTFLADCCRRRLPPR